MHTKSEGPLLIVVLLFASFKFVPVEDVTTEIVLTAALPPNPLLQLCSRTEGIERWEG
jgi:hypothetical protein